MIVKTAPSMDNAKLFMDCLLSDEAQALVAKAYLLPGLGDVLCEGRTNLANIPQIAADWDAMMSVSTETAQNLNASCK